MFESGLNNTYTSSYTQKSKTNIYYTYAINAQEISKLTNIFNSTFQLRRIPLLTL